MKEEYEYCAMYGEQTEKELQELFSGGWEKCDAPDGPVGRDIDKEPKQQRAIFYFRKKV